MGIAIDTSPAREVGPPGKTTDIQLVENVFHLLGVCLVVYDKYCFHI
jgi:hypothetical protein